MPQVTFSQASLRPRPIVGLNEALGVVLQRRWFRLFERHDRDKQALALEQESWEGIQPGTTVRMRGSPQRRGMLASLEVKVDGDRFFVLVKHPLRGSSYWPLEMTLPLNEVQS